MQFDGRNLKHFVHVDDKKTAEATVAIHSQILNVQPTLIASSSSPFALILANKLPCQSIGKFSGSQPPLHKSFFYKTLRNIHILLQFYWPF